MRIDRLLTLTKQLGFDLVSGKKRGRGARRGRGLVPLECLESRQLLSAAGWSALAATGTGPTFVEGLELLPDGTVMVQAGQAGPTNTYYQLTPKSTGNVYPGTTTATGNYVNGSWSPLADSGTASNPAEKRLYNNSVVLPDGRIFTIGGEYSSPEPFSGSSEIFTPSTTGGPGTWAPTARIPTPPTARFFNSNVITGATNASPIVMTAKDTTGLFNGEKVTISGVLGNTAANSPTNTPWTIANLTATTFTLVGSAGNGTYGPTSKATFSVSQFGDDPIQLLPNGKILAGFHAGKETYIYDPIADTWTKTADKLRGDSSDEETWIKLSDGSILSYDVEASIDSGVFHAQRYDPSTNAWVDASAVDAAHAPSLLSDGSPAASGAFASPGALQGEELGPAFMMPNGKAIFFGANGHTAIYNPVTGLWSTGPDEPTKPQSGTITGASNVTGIVSAAGASAGSPLVITTSSTAGLSNGDLVTIAGLSTNNQAANGNWYVRNLTSTTFQLALSSAAKSNLVAGNGINTSGGTWFAGIKITTASTVGLSEGQYVTIAGIAGNTATNGKWAITNVMPTSFQLVGPKPSANFTSGGTWSTSVLTLADASGCMMPNGNILLAFSPLGGLASNGGYSFPMPTYMYEYNTTTGVYTEVPPPSTITDSSYHTFMLALPSGQVLMGNSDLPGGILIYTPTGLPQTAWRPTITGITNSGNGIGTFTLSGTKLRGISEGAAYGDEDTMSTDFPIVQFTDSTGKVTYARSSNWINGGVVAPAVMTSTFTSAPVNGAYLLSVSANGLNSKSVLFVQLGVNADNVTIKVDPSNSALVDVYQFTTLLGKFAKSSITAIDVNGLGALNLDYSNGLFAVPINVNGVLAVSSLSFTRATSISYTVASASSGAFVINGDSANPVTVTNVNVQSIVTAQPKDLLATSGETAVFTAAAFNATGQPLTAKWQFSTDSGGNWTDDTTDTTTTQTDSSGVTHTRLTFEVSTASDVQYRAAFSSDAGLHYKNTNLANLHIATSTTYWVGGGKVYGTTIGSPTNWSEDLNWTNHVPGPNTIAIFAAQVPAYTRWNDTGNMSLTRTTPANLDSNVDGDYVIGGLYLSSTWRNSLTIDNHTLELTGSSEWDSGNFNLLNHAVIANDPNSQLTMNNHSHVDLLGTGELVNDGIMIQTGSVLETHILGIDTGIVLNNAPGGVFDMEVDGGITQPGSGNFINHGLLEKTGGTVGTSSRIEARFTTNGTIDVSQGKLTIVNEGIAFDGIATGDANYAGGNYIVDQGAVLEPFVGANVYVTGTLNGSGNGQFVYGQGNVHSDAGITTLHFSDHLFQWMGGSLLGTWTNTAYLTLSGSGQKLLGGTLHNQSTITQTTDSLQIAATGLLDNQTSAIYNMASDGGIEGQNGQGVGSFLNHGLLVKSVGTAGTSSLIGVNFTTIVGAGGLGSIHVQHGNLVMALPHSSLDLNGVLEPANYIGAAAGSANAIFNLDTGTSLDIAGNAAVTASGTLTGIGSGQVTLNLGRLQTTSGATLHFPDHYFEWNGGNLEGVWTNTAYLTLAGSGTKLLYQCTLHNQNTITQTTDSLRIDIAGLLDNQTGSTYNLASDGGLLGQINGNTGSFLNHGTLVKSVGTAGTQSTIAVNFTTIVGAAGQGSIHVQHGNLVMALPGPSLDLNGVSEPVNYIGDVVGGTKAIFNVDTGTKLDLAGSGLASASGTLSGIGVGQVTLSQGRLDTPTGATLHFPTAYFQWTGGTFTGTWTNTAYVTLAGNVPKILGGTLHNQNTITQTTDSLQIDGRGFLENQVGAIYNLGSDGGISSDANSTGSFVNHGTLKKNLGTVATGSSIVTYFTNDGTIDVIAGKLTIAPLGPASGTTIYNGGTLWVNTGTVLDPTGGRFVVAAGKITGSGTGRVVFGQGTLDADTGGATFSFVTPVFQWTGGTLRGDWTNTAYLTLAGTGQKLIFAGTLHNQNTINQTTDSLQIAGNALLDNQAGATYNLASDGGISGEASSTGSFNNAGQLLKSAGAALASNKPSIVSTTFTNATGATIIVQKGALQINGDVSNTGSVIISPASKLTVGGNYSQGATATLDIQLGGTPASGLFGLLNITPGHVATLGGTLRADLVNGFLPSSGADFTVMTYDSNQASTFAHLTVPVSLPAYVGPQAVTLGKNAAPAGTPKTVTTLEDTSYTFKTLDFGFSDLNNTPSNSLLSVELTTLPVLGIVTDNGTSVTAGQRVLAIDISAGQLKFTPVTNANGAIYSSYTFQVQDNGGTVSGGSDTDPTPRKMTLAVTSVNDAPAGATGTMTVAENTAYQLKVADFGFADVNDVPANTLLAVKFTLLPSAGTGSLTDNGSPVTLNQLVSSTDINAGKLVFTPNTNLLGTSLFLCKFQVEDSGGTAVGGVNLDPTPQILKINLVKVNHPPVGTVSMVSRARNT